MSHPFEMWSDRIAAADSEAARRSLLAELAVWRARNLSDVAASRRATHAIAKVHLLLDDRGPAVNEAKSLLSLCRTPPEATDEELAAATELLRGLGEAVPQLRRAEPERKPRGRDRERPDRPARPERPERPAKAEREGLGPARKAAGAGDWEAAMAALDGQRGAGADLVRAYVALSRTLAAPEDQRAAQLASLQANLRRAAGVKAQREAAPVELTDDPLSKLLGAPTPTRRAARLRAIDRWVEEHPDRVDEMGEAVLRHHVAAHGNTPAPWLVGVVGLALASADSTRTAAAIAELRAAGNVVVDAYDEWPFERLVRVMKRAVATGAVLQGLRRGVLAREEPEDRKIWTLRLAIDGAERMLAVGPHATDPYPEGRAELMAERLQALCSGTALLATGSGNLGLREAAGKRSLVVLEHDADDDALLAAAASASGPEPAPRGPSPTEHLREVLQAEALDPVAVRAAVEAFRRPDRALRPVLGLPLDDERTAALLAAVHELADPDAGIPEGTTVAIRAATRGAATRALLEGPARSRFGGPGIETVVDLAGALAADDWHLHRVLRGPTRRETKAQPALQTLSASLDGLWRLLVRRGDQRGEVWYIAELPVEGRAAVPLLLIEEHPRVVVLPVEADLLGWWGELQGAPSPIGWTGAEADALRGAVSGFEAVASGEADG